MEVNIFDYIKDILFQKKKKFANLSEDQLDFSPFMLQRWCSMSSKDATLIINETTNKWLMLGMNKQLFYKSLIEIIPKQKQKKVAYIKKATNSKKEEHDITSISNTAELSQREIKDAFKLLANLSL